MDDNDDDDYPNMTLHYEPRWKSTVILFLKFSLKLYFSSIIFFYAHIHDQFIKNC